ncbi:hypothetical protein SLA2020_072400 [Shorea laevis]
MKITTTACINVAILFCLAFSRCGGRDPFNAKANVKRFNVLDFGARADGNTDSSRSFIKAFRAACDYNGNAVLVIPQGNFLTGPVTFSGPCINPSPLTVKVTGIIKAQPDVSWFAGGADESDWFTFQNIHGLIITGAGTFDGQGKDAWKYNDCKTNPNCVRMAANIKFIKVWNAIIRGITSVNPKGFHIFISYGQNIRVVNVHLLAPARSPNTDGIHVSKSDMVKISRSSIATGDDCVSMIHGCTNITIKNVTCGPGHGFSIGSLGHYDDEFDVTRIVVTNCTLSNTDNGLRIKTYKDSAPSKASGIYFRDIIMNVVRNPIIIDQEYANSDSNKPSHVRISDVHYTNICGTTTTKVAVNLLCSRTVPCLGLHFNNVNLKYTGILDNNVPFSSSCINARVAYVGFQSPPPCT